MLGSGDGCYLAVLPTNIDHSSETTTNDNIRADTEYLPAVIRFLPVGDYVVAYQPTRGGEHD
jgi:hypothetical protein